MRPLRRHLTFANVMSCIAVFVALATGGAYAANTVFSTDIVDGEVKSEDIEDFTIKAKDIGTGAVNSGRVLDNTLTASDVGPQAVGSSELTDGGVGAADLAPDSVSGPNVAPDSLAGDDIDESSLSTVPSAASAATLDAQAVHTLIPRAFSASVTCDPASATFANCGTSAVGPGAMPASDWVVSAAGAWIGTGAGTEAGECRLVIDDASASPSFAFGQSGNDHDASSRPGTIAMAHVFNNVPAGDHVIRAQCRETNADFIVTALRFTVVRTIS